MRPRERRESGEQDLFRSRLDQIIDMKHPLGHRRAVSISASVAPLLPLLRADASAADSEYLAT